MNALLHIKFLDGSAVEVTARLDASNIAVSGNFVYWPHEQAGECDVPLATVKEILIKPLHDEPKS